MSEDTVPLSRGAAAHRITRQPPEPGSCLAHAGPGPGGGGGAGGGNTAGRHSLRESQTCCRSRLWRLLQKDSGASGRGPEPRGQKGRCHQFQFCPGRPEAAWDFPEWKDRLGGQATWRQGLGAMEVLGIQGGLGVPPWGPHSLPEPPVPHASQPQPRILATEEIIGLLVSSNEGRPRGI